MNQSGRCTLTKILTLILFVGMVAVNALSVLLPINGVTPDQVSDSYPNLFAPAGYTFSIWGLIYLLLAVYTFYMLAGEKAPQSLVCRVDVLFSLSSAANIFWIFAWHYKMIPLSMVLMVVLLVCLVRIMGLITSEATKLSEKFFMKLPFAVYLGWILVATIANATVLLVSLGWDGFGVSADIWTVIVLIVGVIIGILTSFRFQSVAILLVMLWAYAGILYKHLSPAGFDGSYPLVVKGAVASLVLLVIAAVLLVLTGRKTKRRT